MIPPAAGDEFGQAVGVDGDWIAIGAARDDEGETNTGSAYVFSYNGAAWVQAAKLNAPDAAAQDQFGIALAISGDTLSIYRTNDTTVLGTQAVTTDTNANPITAVDTN